MKKYWSIFLFIIIVLATLNHSFASSSGDNSPPPPSGGGGGGGSSPNFYDYYIPLIFNSSNPYGESQVILWVIQPSSLITSFAQDKAGTNVATINSPTKLIFSPSKNFGLTNGSLIRSNYPILVTVQRVTEDVYQDKSFAYSILPSRMMGFEYVSPFDGYLSLFTLSANTIINVYNPSKNTPSQYLISIPGHTTTFPVEAGAKINTTFPVIGAFISYKEGVSASMAVPGYLRGNNYMFDANIHAYNKNEINLSYLTITPDTPTEVKFIYKNNITNEFNIYQRSEFPLSSDLIGINATRGKIEVNFRIAFAYGGITRVSTVQLVAASEMRAGEVFVTPQNYTSNFVVIGNPTGLVSGVYETPSQSAPGYYRAMRSVANLTTYDSFTYNGKSDTELLIGNNTLFGFVSLPAQISFPMGPSLTFLNIPINTVTQQNRTGLTATWYRFPDLAAKSIRLIPSPAEEYTGQTIEIIVVSNGSLPAGAFQVQITINGEKTNYTYNFLQAGSQIKYDIRKFFPLGMTKLTVSVNVDTQNQVNEINENDNQLTYTTKVLPNIRLRVTVILFFVLVLIFIILQVRKWIINQKKLSRAHIDAIVEFSEETK